MTTYDTLFSIRRLWIILAASMLVMFGTLLYFGREIYQAAPPIPAAVRTAAGDSVFTREQISSAVRTFGNRSAGCNKVPIWGHGSYVAPDWSADWLHREAEALLDLLARQERGAAYAQQPAPEQARLRAMLQRGDAHQHLRAAAAACSRSPTIGLARSRSSARIIPTFSCRLARRAAPARAVCVPGQRDTHGRGIRRAERVLLLDGLGRDHGAARANRSPTRATGRTSRSSATRRRRGVHVDLHLDLRPAWRHRHARVVLRARVRHLAPRRRAGERVRTPGLHERGDRDAFDARDVGRYFVVVTLLFVAQVLLGIVTAHYAVEGQGLYGLPLSDLSRTPSRAPGIRSLPCSGSRRRGSRPASTSRRCSAAANRRFQAAGVWFLLVSLVVIVAGSFAGEWLAINRMIADATQNFWFGHQGYEYVDLGRFWQIYLFVGLLLWVALVLRGLWPALRQQQDGRSLVVPRGRRDRRDRAAVRSRPHVRPGTRTSRSWSTGAGGSCTFGSRAYSRCSRPRSSPRCSCAWDSCGFRWRRRPCSSPRSSFSAAASSARSIISIAAGRRSA